MSKAKPAAGKQTANQQAANLSDLLEQIMLQAENDQKELMKLENYDGSLTPKERKRLISAGAKNYGFIDTVYDVIAPYTNLMPGSFSIGLMSGNIQRLEELRNCLIALENLTRVVSDILLLRTDKAYHEALSVYDIIRDLARSKNPDAIGIYEKLKSFFNKRRAPKEGELTEKEVERDIKRLLKGTADGEIEIVNERPQVKAGVHKVVDNVRTGRAIAKEDVEVDVKEGSRKK